MAARASAMIGVKSSSVPLRPHYIVAGIEKKSIANAKRVVDPAHARTHSLIALSRISHIFFFFGNLYITPFVFFSITIAREISYV